MAKIFAGIYDPSTSEIESSTDVGGALGFFPGKNLPPTFPVNYGYYVVVSKEGTPKSPAPEVPLYPVDYLISTKEGWVVGGDG